MQCRTCWIPARKAYVSHGKRKKKKKNVGKERENEEETMNKVPRLNKNGRNETRKPKKQKPKHTTQSCYDSQPGFRIQLLIGALPHSLLPPYYMFDESDAHTAVTASLPPGTQKKEQEKGNRKKVTTKTNQVGSAQQQRSSCTKETNFERSPGEEGGKNRLFISHAPEGNKTESKIN